VQVWLGWQEPGGQLVEGTGLGERPDSGVFVEVVDQVLGDRRDLRLISEAGSEQGGQGLLDACLMPCLMPCFWISRPSSVWR